MTDLGSVFKKNFLAEFIEAQISTSIMLGGLVLQESRNPLTALGRHERDVSVHTPFLVEDDSIRYTAIAASTVSVLVSSILAQEKSMDIAGATSMAWLGAFASATELGRRVRENRINTQDQIKRDYLAHRGLKDYIKDIEGHKVRVKNLVDQQEQVTQTPQDDRIRSVYYEALTQYKESRQKVDYRVIDPKTTTLIGDTLLDSEKFFRHKVERAVLDSTIIACVAITSVRALYAIRKSIV